MKKSILILVSVVMLASLLVGCAPKNAAVGATVLKVTGDIGNKNSGDAYILDEAAFEKMSVERVMDDAWMGDGLNYKGILLSDLIKELKPSANATTISVISTDKKSVDVSIEDANKWEIMMVHYKDGAVVTEKDGGPVKIAFPTDARTKYTDEMWMWWVVELKFK